MVLRRSFSPNRSQPLAQLRAALPSSRSILHAMTPALPLAAKGKNSSPQPADVGGWSGRSRLRQVCFAAVPSRRRSFQPQPASPPQAPHPSPAPGLGGAVSQSSTTPPSPHPRIKRGAARRLAPTKPQRRRRESSFLSCSPRPSRSL